MAVWTVFKRRTEEVLKEPGGVERKVRIGEERGRRGEREEGIGAKERGERGEEERGRNKERDGEKETQLFQLNSHPLHCIIPVRASEGEREKSE